MLKMNRLSIIIYLLKRVIFTSTQMFKIPMSELSFNRIKELLAKKGRQSTELAEYAEVTTRTVSTWCTNRNQPPVEMLFKIAEFLEMEAGELLTLKKDLIPVGGKKDSGKKSGVRKSAPVRKGASRKRS